MSNAQEPPYADIDAPSRIRDYSKCAVRYVASAAVCMGPGPAQSGVKTMAPALASDNASFNSPS